MIDTKKTLINLHERFPEMSLDDLFAVLECVVEYGITLSNPFITTPSDPILGPKIY